MSGYLPVTFIEEKVKDLENALFFSMSDAVLKIPACVIRILETDELGQLWFMIPKPSQHIHAFDKTFPVKLDFFRKGKEYYLQILGKAFLVNDPEEINSVDCLNESIKQQARQNETVLVKVQILGASYVEKAPVKTSAKDLIGQVKSKLYRWFQASHQTPGFQNVPGEVRYPALSSFSN
jgi:general stress protein 26